MITLERLARETQLHGKRVELIEGLITDEMTPPAAAPGPAAIINEQRHAEIIAGDRRVPRSGRIVAPTRTLTVVDRDRAQDNFLRDVGDTRAARAAYERLIERYGEGPRRYHGVAHVLNVVETVEALDANRATRLAAWYHDAIYDATSATNEEDSAELAISELRALEVDEAVVADVARLVRMTRNHEVGAPDEAVLADADLAILAVSADEYARYGSHIRTEYAHVNDEDWRAGRLAFLDRCLGRERLYHTDIGQTWEAAARANLQRERATLIGDRSSNT